MWLLSEVLWFDVGMGIVLVFCFIVICVRIVSLSTGPETTEPMPAAPGRGMTRTEFIEAARKVILVLEDVNLGKGLHTVRGDVFMLQGVPASCDGDYNKQFCVADQKGNWPTDREEMVTAMLDKIADHESLEFEGANSV